MQNFKKICTLATSLVLAAGILAAFPESSVQELSAETTYVSNDFDVEYEGWCNVGVNTMLTADEQNPHEGTRSMLVSNRLSAEDGASSAKGLWLWGGENYNYSVFVKHSSEGEENFKLSLSYLLEDGETWKDTVIAEKSAASGEWTELEGKFRAPEGATEFIVKITTDSTCDFWFDDFTASGKKTSSRTVSAAEKGLKDEFANYFRVGNILNGGTVKNSAITAMYLRDFNSIECENETKPDATIVRGGNHSNTNIQVSLNSCAAIADFCSKNGLGFRGHTLVWHSQTPQFFFKDNFQDSGNWVSSSVMDQRMESYIKNIFNAFKTQYPNLNIYAYDVANECMNDSNGGPRTGGWGNGASPWTQIYGGNSFIEKAFKYARQYAPAGCDLKQEKTGVQYGTVKSATYYSTTCNRNKPYNILLPANYSTDKQYPVLYVMHGYWENQDRMIIKGNGTMYTRQIIGNAIADGSAEDMIVVFPYIYSSATQENCSAMDDANNAAYDNFINDLTKDLMPHIEKTTYSIKTGRENTAITGFSMGGRESLLIGMKRPDLFGYVGAICPAPGVTGAFKWNSEEESPSLLFITAGSNDTVVYSNPETYHNNFTKNGVPHIWHYVNGGYHGDNSIHAHIYNFVKCIFKTW